MLLRLTAAIGFSAALAGAAHAYEPYGGPEILPELPPNAPPGECYARVKVPGGPAYAPPSLQGARWVQMPGPPGAPGPIWCLVPTGAAPVAFEAPARYGFIRVLCEEEMTTGRVSGIQRQLHRRGFYRGGFSGRYDGATAAAVREFQTHERIGHGGYLSYDTVQALDAGGYPGQGFPPAYDAPVYGGDAYGERLYGGTYGSSYSSSAYTQSYSSSSYSSQGYGGYATGGHGWAGSNYPCLNPCVAAAPPPPPPPVCVQCVPCNPCAGAGYYGGGYGYSSGAAYHSPPGYYGPPMPAYKAYGARSAVQNGWLTWQGKGW